MAIIFHVTLNTNVTPPSLDVDETGDINRVGTSPQPQQLQWQLTGNAAQGSFNAILSDKPGFQWMQPAPPSTIFTPPTLTANGNQISIYDTHTDASSNGSWMYQLNATIGGQQYSTQVQRLTGTTKNPIIVNK